MTITTSLEELKYSLGDTLYNEFNNIKLKYISYVENILFENIIKLILIKIKAIELYIKNDDFDNFKQLYEKKIYFSYDKPDNKIFNTKITFQDTELTISDIGAHHHSLEKHIKLNEDFLEDQNKEDLNVIYCLIQFRLYFESIRKKIKEQQEYYKYHENNFFWGSFESLWYLRKYKTIAAENDEFIDRFVDAWILNIKKLYSNLKNNQSTYINTIRSMSGLGDEKFEISKIITLKDELNILVNDSSYTSIDSKKK